MPKQIEAEKGTDYTAAALAKIKEAVPLDVLYKRIHGHSPDPMEEKRFYNRFREGRGNPGMGFLGVCVANCPEIHDLTLTDVFDIKPKKRKTQR